MRFRILCLLLVVGVLLFSVVGVAPVSATVTLEELGYDDGRFETHVMLQYYYDNVIFALNTNNYVDGVPHIMHLRQKFVLSDFGLSGTYKVEAVKVCWGYLEEVIDTVVFDIRLRDEDGTPTTVLRDLVSPDTPTWHRYDDVSSAGFTSNLEIFVELIAKSGAEFVAADSGPSPIGSELSEYSTDENGETWAQDTLYYGIHVIVSQVLAPVPEFSLSIPIVTSIATVVYLAIRKRIVRKLK